MTDSSSTVAFGRGPQTAARVVRRRQREAQPDSQHGPGITHPAAAFVFDPDRDNKLPAPYWTLGDDSMETDEARELRSELRSHPAVQDGLRRLSGTAFARSDDGSVSRSEYLHAHTKIAQVLAPTMPQDIAIAAAEREWQADSGGMDSIAGERIYDALFELVDMWCQTTEAEEYLAFLEALRFKLRFSSSDSG